MSAQFDSHADSYREEVNRAISFVGKDVDFFAGRKARLLQAAARRLIGDPAELSILDVGCGIGLVDRYLSSAFRSVAGVDVSPAELAIASAQHPQVSYTLSHAGRLPYDPGSFDVAFAACVLHHVDEDDHASFGAEIGRVVRPGGLVVVFEHNPLNPLTRLAVRRTAFDAGVHLLRARNVSSLLLNAGLESIQVVYTTFLPFRGGLAQRIEDRLTHCPLGGQYAVLARKAPHQVEVHTTQTDT